MQHEQLVRTFGATVQASLHGMTELEPVLLRERDALSGKDPAQLTAVVEEKLAQLKALEPSVQARDRLLSAAGFETGIEGGNQLVKSLGDASLAADWERLTKLAANIATINDINAQLVHQGQRATRQALGMLTGRPGNTDTYTDLRRKAGGHSSHTLGKV